jgi:hypothetical protein
MRSGIPFALFDHPKRQIYFEHSGDIGTICLDHRSGEERAPDTQDGQLLSLATSTKCKPRERLNACGVNDLRFMGLGRVELPTYAYQTASHEHESGSEVPTRLPFTNILLSMWRN